MSTTWINRGHLYAPHVTPVLVDCRFVVDPANANGNGTSGLTGQGVQNVYMHTSTTPSAGNPNPAAGLIMVQLSDNFSQLYALEHTLTSPVVGGLTPTTSTSTTANVINVIQILGTATLAQWRTVGLPAGITPAVGVAFIATSAALIGGSAAVSLISATGTGISHIEVAGSPKTTLAPVPVGGSPNVGGLIMLSCFGQSVTMNSYTPAGTNDGGTPPLFTGTPAVLTGTVTDLLKAPATGSHIRLLMYLSQSSVAVAGE